jgi:hypothetical protein
MDTKRSEFLTSMISILDRLHATTVQRGEPLLASVLAIAKGEAEDALRHAEELAHLDSIRQRLSSQNSWRPGEQPAATDADAWPEPRRTTGDDLAA